MQPPSSRPVVLVTGAGKRIGRSIALHLGRHGFDVAVHFLRSADEATDVVDRLVATGAGAAAFQADLAAEPECAALASRVEARFGRLDAVVNSASTFQYDDVESFSYAGMERHWRANTGPAIVLSRALARCLHGKDALGCVVNLLDQKLWNPNPDYLSYTLSKAALEAATVALAQALAPKVRVCGVAPGLTLPSGPMSASQFEAAHRMTPLQRASTEDDIAAAVLFLMTSPAITGTTLVVDGGQHLTGQPRDVLFLGSQNSERTS